MFSGHIENSEGRDQPTLLGDHHCTLIRDLALPAYRIIVSVNVSTDGKYSAETVLMFSYRDIAWNTHV